MIKYQQIVRFSDIIIQLIIILLLFFHSMQLQHTSTENTQPIDVHVTKIISMCKSQNQLTDRNLKYMLYWLAYGVNKNANKNMQTEDSLSLTQISKQVQKIAVEQTIVSKSNETKNIINITKELIQKQTLLLNQKLIVIQKKLEQSVTLINTVKKVVEQIKSKIQLALITTPKQVAEIIKKKKKVMFVTGRAVSTQSGVPSITSQDQYWQKLAVSPYTYLKTQRLNTSPLEIWNWVEYFYSKKQKCVPNQAHIAIDNICNGMKGKCCVVTQNIDNLHKQCQEIYKCPHKYQIYQIHGNVLFARCDSCSIADKNILIPYEQCRKSIKQQKIPSCPTCKQNLRPHVMLFDEAYQQKLYFSQTVKLFVEQCDLLVVVGSALRTGLVKSLIKSFIQMKREVIEINTECVLKQKNVINLTGKCEQILHEVNKYM